jgi:hypothetical protein
LGFQQVVSLNATDIHVFNTDGTKMIEANSTRTFEVTFILHFLKFASNAMVSDFQIFKKAMTENFTSSSELYLVILRKPY